MDIRTGSVDHPQVIGLLSEHLTDMYATSPAESVHALDISALQKQEITFFSAWHEQTLLGCAALKHHTAEMAELKSMRTSNNARNQGVASKLLSHVLDIARQSNYQQVLLETGSQPFFLPARALYSKNGFTQCSPFADYVEDPNSVFMQLRLQ